MTSARRTKQALAAAAVLAVLAALVAAHASLQPPGVARVVRRGDAVRTLEGRLALAPRYLGEWCEQALAGDRLHAELTPTVVGSAGESYELAVEVDYRPPARLPAGWPEGDWCRGLAAVVNEEAGAWLRGTSPDELFDRPRAAEESGAASLRRALEERGLAVASLELALGFAGVDRPREVPEVVAAAAPGRKVIVLALDGADWEMLRPLVDEGRMPELRRLLAEGRWGDLETQHPPLSPILWTTMMTGADPLEHGVLDFTRYHPESGVKEPITSDERRRPAVWNMATYGGRSVAVFGLWATFPAEAVDGLLVSDRLFTFLYREAAPPRGAVYPPSRERWARRVLDAAEREIGYEEVRAFLPWLGRDAYERWAAEADPYAHPVSALRRILVETEVYDTLASEAIRAEDPDLAIVYVQGTDSVGHVFAQYAPPRQPSVSPEEYERYRRVPGLYFELVDELLGRYRHLAEERDSDLVLVSDHGFRWHEGRPEQLSSFAAATAAKWHRDEGIYLHWRPGRTAGGRGEPGGIQQTCATLLALLGLPRGAGIEDEPLAGIGFASRETVDYERFFEPPAPPDASSAAGGEEELAKLRALGYLAAREPVRAPAAVRRSGSTRSAGSYNNAGLILRRRGETEKAIAAYEKALEIDPDLGSAAWNLSDLLFAEERELERSDRLLVRAYRNDTPEGHERLVGRAIGYARDGRRDRSLALLAAALEVRPEKADLWLFRGRYRVDDGRCAEALADFRQAARLDPDNPAVYASVGLAQVCLEQPARARAAFRRSLALDPDQPRLRALLAQLGPAR